MKKQWILTTALALGLGLLGAAPALAADWPQFLGEEDSRGVADAATPRNADELELLWVAGTSDGWTGVPGTPIVQDGYVYYYGSQYLHKQELETGKEVASVQIYSQPTNQFFIYLAAGDGKIFVPCQSYTAADGSTVKECVVRVFDADTLEQLYITESLGSGQMQSPLIYHDGYLVSGVYGRNADYFCFQTDDADPKSSDEVKEFTWTLPSVWERGYTWNGAVFVDDYCYFGSGGSLMTVDYRTGEYTATVLGEGFRISSTPTWDEETGRLYVSAVNANNGATVSSYTLKSDGTPDTASLKRWETANAVGGVQSSPVIHNGRLYIGGGASSGSAETFHVLDAATMKEIYAVPIVTSASAAVSTGYATKANGQLVYIYMVPYAPVADESQLWIIKDAAGQTKADYQVISGIGHAQYCSQTIAVADNGSLLWYNDAGYLYCYGKADAGQNTPEQTAPEQTTPAPGDAAGKQTFADIDGHWAEQDIIWMLENGYVNGKTATAFDPEGIITRAEFVQLLYNLTGDKENAADAGFADVDGQWFADAVNWAAAAGVASGEWLRDGEIIFSPNAPISRQDMAVMLHNYVNKVADGGLEASQAAIEFTDAAAISAYARGAVSAMQQAGLISGVADGAGYAFQPKAFATRAQAAKILAGYLR